MVVGILETQLETWSAQGKTGQFTDTHRSIRDNLRDSSAPYLVSNCEVFLQGSYANDTNVYADSDVDIVLKHNGAFYYDLSNMSAPAQASFKSAFPTDAEYGYTQFKADAVGWITRLYNGAVPGKKAIYVPGKGNRRNADILVAQQFRRYYEFTAIGTERYEEGLCFYSNGVRIENFPKQHSANCTAKHQATGNNFKLMVRVFKNMRNAMVSDGFFAEGVAPSYFLEGMLYNVPNDKFVGNHIDMWIKCFNWIVTAERDDLVCANSLHWLVRDGTPTSWPVASFNAFTAAAKKYWER
jgi:hypothetical protein